MKQLDIALPKGRLGEKVLAMFEKAGFDCPAIHEENRKLIFENERLGLRFFWVKPSDVAIYVARRNHTAPSSLPAISAQPDYRQQIPHVRKHWQKTPDRC